MMKTKASKTIEKVLFICNQNSARSQMAEGILKSLYDENFEFHSAGSNPSTVNPHAIKVLKEMSVDISENRSKSLKEFQGLEFDYVVTESDMIFYLLELLFVFIIWKMLHLHRFFLSSFNAFSNSFSCSGVICIHIPYFCSLLPEISQYLQFNIKIPTNDIFFAFWLDIKQIPL